MSSKDLIGMVRRGLKKPPKVIVDRIITELIAEGDRFFAPRRASGLNERTLLRKLDASSLEDLWKRLGEISYPAETSTVVNHSFYEEVCPGDRLRILKAAEDAICHRVDLLGSGKIELGGRIEWHKDYKTGISWHPAYIRNIDYNNSDRPSDVKFPWEVSRMQWVIPAGQAFLLTGEERYAEAVRDILDNWIDSNPYAQSVNWACTMEAALRILTWSWFFHVFKCSKAWADRAFRYKFLKALYLHGDFTARNLEKSDVNGNHYTADAAGLVFAGLFFGCRGRAAEWQQRGWEILLGEMPLQVFEDGVDFEASIPYHRLVFELFFLPALFRKKIGLCVDPGYLSRLALMAGFTLAYSRTDGTVPLVGDADDARALPFGGQGINDHRYLSGLLGLAFDLPELIKSHSGSRSEAFWLFGEQASRLPETSDRDVGSASFPEGGFYVMRNNRDHVFIDCGPLGLKGRGGHGHNDCLSFEAALDGVQLISDCGAYLYTASYKDRNLFRSTAYHNTPQVDGEEINRFIRWDFLWTLHYDAKHKVELWKKEGSIEVFMGSHSGYGRLPEPIIPVRTIILDHELHGLVIHDRFLGEGAHRITIPLHLAPGVIASCLSDGVLSLKGNDRVFNLSWSDPGKWAFREEEGRISPSYGVALKTNRLLWERDGKTDSGLLLCIVPEGASPERALKVLQKYIGTDQVLK